MASIIDSLYTETSEIITKLAGYDEISLSTDAKRHLTKVFILSVASYFEDWIQKLLISYISKECNSNYKVVSFFKKKAISLQYHTYFSWGEKDDPDKPGKNANSFFSLFGDDFKNDIVKKIKGNSDLENSIKCFIEIGHIRNVLVHSNFAAYNSIEKTIEEFYSIYNSAVKFIIFFEDFLKSHSVAAKL